MSYTVTITRNNISQSDEKAWAELDELYEKEDAQNEQSADFLDLIEKLKSNFPCICDLPDNEVDNGVWSDGPLSNNAGKDLTTLGVAYFQVDTVIPFLIKTANENGFVVFDSQSGKISRPDDVDNSSRPTNPQLQVNKSFWKRLFGK